MTAAWQIPPPNKLRCRLCYRSLRVYSRWMEVHRQLWLQGWDVRAQCLASRTLLERRPTEGDGSRFRVPGSGRPAAHVCSRQRVRGSAPRRPCHPPGHVGGRGVLRFPLQARGGARRGGPGKQRATLWPWGRRCALAPRPPALPGSAGSRGRRALPWRRAALAGGAAGWVLESGFVGPRGAERLQRRNAVRPAAGRPRGRAPGPVGQHQLVPGGRRLQRPAPGPPPGPVRRAPGERPAGPGRGRRGPGGEAASRGREVSFARGDLAGGPPALRGQVPGGGAASGSGPAPAQRGPQVQWS